MLDVFASSFGKVMGFVAVSLSVLMLSVVVHSNGAYAQSEIPNFFPLKQINVQYQDRTCGYRTVAISMKLEYSDLDHSSRLAAFEPKIQSVLYLRLSDYFNKAEKPSNKDLKRIMKRSVDGVVGEGIIVDVLILNVVYA